MKTPSLKLAAALVAALGFAAPVVQAQDHANHQHHQTPPQETVKAAPSEVKYGDTVLLDQMGKQHKLKSEVFGDRLVVLDFAYTSCTTICPVLSALMAKVQNQLGDRLGKEVSLVTITVDPARDTPARLREYAAKYGAKPGWAWLSGPTGTVNEVLKGFGAYAPNFEDHPPQVLVGDPTTGDWTRFFGFADPQAIMAKVDELAHARHMAPPAANQHQHHHH
jgi:protein SCO1/2